MLTLLPAREFARLLSQAERVHLQLKQILYETDASMVWVYFPIDAVVSLLTVLKAADARAARGN